MIPIIIIVISLLFDGLLTNYLPYLVNDLSYFTPLFTVVSIFIIYPFYRKNNKKYFITVFLLGFIYDLFYTNLLFYNAVIFLIIGIISRFINKNFETSFLKLIIYTVIIVVLYESISAGILFVFNIVPISFDKLFYKISHSLLLNIIYMETIYIVIKIIPKKYKEISIN